MASLRNYSIQSRLWAILGASIIVLLLVLTYNLITLHQTLFEARSLVVKQQVSTAFTLVNHFHQLEQTGQLSQTQAQQQAKEALRALRYRGQEYFWINDTQPTMVMHPFNPKLEGQSLSNYQDPNGFKLFVEMVRVSGSNPEGGYVNYQWPKPGAEHPVDKISFVRQFTPWQWIIGTGLYTDDLRTTFMEQAWGLMVVVGGLIILIVLFNALVSRSIRRPLQGLTRAMNEVAKGEGDLTQRLPEQGKDELNKIAHAFNNFVEQIQQVIEKTQRTATELVQQNQQIAHISEQSTHLTQGQLTQSDQVATASNEMSLTIQEIAANAERAASAASAADDNAQQGMRMMQQSQQSILALAKEVQDSSTIIQQLEQETQSIGSVLDVIRGVAEQTNLLALNAAIEAARAGEQGRGFAVVADEVRTLASRTQESTEEIHKMISRLQQQAQQAVQAMTSNAQNSEHTAHNTELALATIAEISTAISTITEMNLSIASAVEEQSAAANEITSNITQIADSSGKISDNMSETHGAIATLNHDIRTLSNLVQRFKV